jgi:cysteinyl-tRNA synthetase
MNFTWNSIAQAHKNNTTIQNFAKRLQNFKSINSPASVKIDIDKFKNAFESAMDDDLNTPLALTVLFALITETNILMDNNTLYNSNEIFKFLTKICNTLGITLKLKPQKIPQEILILAKKRDSARKNNNYSLSDKLRNEITDQGYDIQDTANGFSLKKL